MITKQEIYELVDARTRFNRAFRRTVGNAWEDAIGPIKVKSPNTIAYIAGAMDCSITRDQAGNLSVTVDDARFVYEERES